MRIEGEWFRGDDESVRPVLEVDVYDRNGEPLRERFLIDSGSDHSVFSALLLRRLRIPGESPPTGFGLVGIGGSAPSVVVRTTIEFLASDGRPATVRGQFAAFTDPRTTDQGILGRDVLDNFDVILSRRRDEMLLLAGNHQYQVTLV
jgi:Aspartyl protease